MYTSVAWFALAGVFAGQAPSAAPTWMTDYAQALQAGKKDARPLAVFITGGAKGYDQVSRAGTLNTKARELLAKNYVCVYVDTTQAAGRRLADALEITKGRGLVISDRTGQVQAFHHDGDLSDAELARHLERFANAAAVRTTESNGTSRVSYYPASNGARPQYAPPVYFGGGGGRAC